MLTRSLVTAAAMVSIGSALGCGSPATDGAGGGATSAANGASQTAASAGIGATTSSSATSSASGGGSTGAGTGGGSGVPTAADLLALTTQCNQLSNGFFKADSGASSTANIPICGLVGAVFWKADMDIDCDGKMTTQCNLQTDPAYQNQTAASDSNGNALDAANLPYVVIPGSSIRFNYPANGLHMGSVVAVIYNGKVAYGVSGDSGPSAIIGEASYAMASALGINPNPSTGGVDSGVTYIAFTGAGGVSAPIENATHTTMLGETLAATLVANGGL